MNHKALLRDSALTLVPLVAVGAWLGGAWGAAGTAIAGVVTLVNVRIWMGLTSRFLQGMEREEGADALAIIGFFVKPPLTLGIFAALMYALDPMSVALGITCLVAGIFVRGIVTLLNTPVDPVVESQ